jgi:hypothetical protein
MSSSTLDPYTANAENTTLTPQEKIAGSYLPLVCISFFNSAYKGLHAILKSAKIGMLTTHGVDGLHSRAMIPSSRLCIPRSDNWRDSKVLPPTAFSDTQLTLVFIANNATAKFDEIKNDSHVNVSFCDTNSTSWASYVMYWMVCFVPLYLVQVFWHCEDKPRQGVNSQTFFFLVSSASRSFTHLLT